jgi:CRP-like cAMP-binding protein
MQGMFGVRNDFASPRNLLLRSLSRQDFERLSPFLETVPLVPRRIIQHAKFPVEYLYFVEEGLVSVLATADERDVVEVWLIGREGVVGGPTVLGVNSTSLRHVVRVGGHALRIAVDDIALLNDEIPMLRTALLNYVHVTLMQSSQSAACSLRHSFPQRLARWLLTAQDRIDSNELPVTQALLARTLGVRRATVSETIKTFERRGVLARLRGLIRISDRARLEKLSCSCYRIIRREQERPLRWQTERVPLFALQAVCCLV